MVSPSFKNKSIMRGGVFLPREQNTGLHRFSLIQISIRRAMTKLNDAMNMSSSEDESDSYETSDTESDQHEHRSIDTEASVDEEQDNISVSSTTMLRGDTPISVIADTVSVDVAENNLEEIVKDEVEKKELNEHHEKLKVVFYTF